MTFQLPSPPPSPTPTSRSNSDTGSITLPRSQQSIETDLATLEAMIEELGEAGRRGRIGGSGTGTGRGRRRTRTRCVERVEDVSGAMRVCAIGG
ncbi:chromatin remodeling complex subunit [Aspergillus luchuensis]|uniref:Chromatin remodeling complex subunit n=1 Tax=Aspergillus kawachii TaxID=1069201 RepID=A0A146FC97_ASPKA|nr:chromatin remodeling complex subunit [Aspergillus luchuensis]